MARGSDRPPLWVIIGIAAIIVGGLYWATEYASKGGLEGRDGAAFVCEDFVARELPVPSTAEFPGTDRYRITGSGSIYTVRGYVDAEDESGAMIRSSWTCTVEEADARRWVLQSLSGVN